MTKRRWLRSIPACCSNLWPVVSDQWRWGCEASRSNLDHLMQMFRVYAFTLVQSGRLMLLIRGDRDITWTSRPIRVHVYVCTRLYVYKRFTHMVRCFEDASAAPWTQQVLTATLEYFFLVWSATVPCKLPAMLKACSISPVSIPSGP